MEHEADWYSKMPLRSKASCGVTRREQGSAGAVKQVPLGCSALRRSSAFLRHSFGAYGTLIEIDYVFHVVLIKNICQLLVVGIFCLFKILS